MLLWSLFKPQKALRYLFVLFLFFVFITATLPRSLLCSCIYLPCQKTKAFIGGNSHHYNSSQFFSLRWLLYIEQGGKCAHLKAHAYLCGNPLFPAWPCFDLSAEVLMLQSTSKASAAGKLRTIFLGTYHFKLKSNRILLFWKYHWGFFRLTRRKILIKIFLFWSKCWKHEKKKYFKQTESLVCKENKVNSINYIHILLVGKRLALRNFLIISKPWPWKCAKIEFELRVNVIKSERYVTGLL